MAVKLQCPKHPRYSAKINPKANCEHCIYLYSVAIAALAARIKVN
jgi:hypothetical protein